MPCATLYTEDDTGARQPLTDTSKVKPGTKVYIEYDEDAAKEQYGENFIFNGWEMTDEGSLQFHAAMNEHFLPGFPASEVPLFLPLRQSFIVFAFFSEKFRIVYLQGGKSVLYCYIELTYYVWLCPILSDSEGLLCQN